MVRPLNGKLHCRTSSDWKVSNLNKVSATDQVSEATPPEIQAKLSTGAKVTYLLHRVRMTGKAMPGDLQLYKNYVISSSLQGLACTYCGSRNTKTHSGRVREDK